MLRVVSRKWSAGARPIDQEVEQEGCEVGRGVDRRKRSKRRRAGLAPQQRRLHRDGERSGSCAACATGELETAGASL